MCEKFDSLTMSQNSLTSFSHDTISVAARQFYIMPMGPMIGVMVTNEVLMTHQCQAMTQLLSWDV
jgi:hypothetical protein